MADKENNGAQNIDGVLEQLKQSYGTESNGASNTSMVNESVAENVSGDELQARLKTQFLNEDAKSTEKAEDEYLIDEDFLRDAYSEEEAFDEEIITEEKTEDSEYGFNEEYEENEKEDKEKEDKEDALGEEDAQEDKGYKEEPIIQSSQEESAQEEVQEIEEGLQEIQEEEYNEAFEEIYEEEEDQEIQEGDSESVQIIQEADESYLDDGDIELLWNDEEPEYEPLTVEDVEELSDYEDELNPFEITEDTRTDAEKAEDNYVGVFYRSNERDPYENMSFKERIAENAPTVDSLKEELNYEEEDFSLEEFAEAESIPLVLDEDDTERVHSEITEPSEPQVIADGSELDRSDLALLLEFGYEEEILKTVSDDDIEKLSNEELIDSIEFDRAEEEVLEEPSSEADSEAKIAEKAKQKIQGRYEEYRKKRGGALLKLIISAVISVFLFFYEALPTFGLEFGGILNRDDYFFAYVLIGLQLLVLVTLPAVKSVAESVKNVIARGINSYLIAGAAVLITVLYDFVVLFEKNDVPPTFHFCAAIAILLAELSAFMKLTAEIRNYEYYFSEYLFEYDGDDGATYKFTLAKSEGRGSLAEKMYAGGLDDNTEIFAPQSVESVNGFFEANKRASKRSKMTLSWIIVSAVAAFILTVVAGIIYEEVWVAAAAFIITFELSMPIIATVIEWLPFERLSAHNYTYGAAFASEGSIEKIDKCDMLAFNDFHIFEKCDARSVNLAIYDSTSKALLLSCLNSVYSEIGGPLEAAFSSIKVQQIGKCKINRVARSGVEALVGASYSVLVGDEAFMSRYGVYFPKAALGKEEDKIFTLCVSINNRPTARIAVKYKINQTFYSILQKLSEDKITCVIQTYDPMISTELISRVRPYEEKAMPINVVHKSASELALEKHKHKSGAIYSVKGEELSVLARGSRLNLAVALSNAKKLNKLRFVLNICSGALISAGALTAMLLVLSNKLDTLNWWFVLFYWIIGGGITAGLFAWKFPQKDRFIFNKKGKDRG